MQKLTKILEHGVFGFFVAVGFFAMMNTTYAISTIVPFGGTVKEDSTSKAKNIQDIENEDYKCTVPGNSMTVKSINKTEQNQDFLIPYTTRSSTNHKTEQNQYFLGLYEKVSQTVSCIYQGYPPRTKTTQLNRLKLFGTSKGKVLTY